MKRSAIAGGFVWLGLSVADLLHKIDLTWIELLFLFAPLVIVPLGLELTARNDEVRANSKIEKSARVIKFPAALLTVAAFFFAAGPRGAALVLPWFAFCAVLAIAGLQRLVRGAHRELAATCTAVAFLYPTIGAAWLVASRVGLTPLNFQEPIVLLTAVHFHYAGFAAPLLAGSTARALATHRPMANNPLFRATVGAVLAGPAILAAGFVIGPRVKLAAALILAASEIGLAIFFVLALRAVEPLLSKLLIAVASASVIFSMALAALWAVGEYPLQPFVHLANMARFHGTANGFGFTLCGLLGFILARHSMAAERSAST